MLFRWSAVPDLLQALPGGAEWCSTVSFWGSALGPQKREPVS